MFAFAGLGNLFGEKNLRLNMEKHEQLKVVETELWDQFLRYVYVYLTSVTKHEFKMFVFWHFPHVHCNRVWMLAFAVNVVVMKTVTPVKQWQPHWEHTLNWSVLSMLLACLTAVFLSVSEIKELFGWSQPERLSPFLFCGLLFDILGD